MKDILRLLSAGKPFFPDTVGAMQMGPGTAMRQLWITAAVSLAARTTARPRILEIGSWMGGSMLTLAAALDKFSSGGGEILCVDTWSPYITRAEVSDSKFYATMDEAAGTGLAYAIFCHNASCAPATVRVDHMRGRSRDLLPLLRDGMFDLIYVDGSHYYADVVADLAEAKRLVGRNGVLCGDDLEHEAHELDPQLLRDNLHNDVAGDPKSGRWFHPGVTLAVAEAFAKVQSYAGFWAVRREGDGFVPADLYEERLFLPGHIQGSSRDIIVEWMKKSGYELKSQ
jgi:predicted O-methyltransferase YrrM